MPHMNGASERLNFLYHGESGHDGVVKKSSDFSHYNGIVRDKDKPKKRIGEKIARIIKRNR